MAGEDIPARAWHVEGSCWSPTRQVGEVFGVQTLINSILSKAACQSLCNPPSGPTRQAGKLFMSRWWQHNISIKLQFTNGPHKAKWQHFFFSNVNPVPTLRIKLGKHAFPRTNVTYKRTWWQPRVQLYCYPISWQMRIGLGTNRLQQCL